MARPFVAPGSRSIRRLGPAARRSQLLSRGRPRSASAGTSTSIEIPLAGVAAVADSSAQLAQRDELERGFRRLDPDLRAALVLRFYEGLSLAEVADAMGVRLGTAKSRLNRAAAAMRANLDADARSSLLPEGPLG